MVASIREMYSRGSQLHYYFNTAVSVARDSKIEYESRRTPHTRIRALQELHKYLMKQQKSSELVRTGTFIEAEEYKRRVQSDGRGSTQENERALIDQNIWHMLDTTFDLNALKNLSANDTYIITDNFVDVLNWLDQLTQTQVTKKNPKEAVDQIKALANTIKDQLIDLFEPVVHLYQTELRDILIKIALDDRVLEGRLGWLRILTDKDLLKRFGFNSRNVGEIVRIAT